MRQTTLLLLAALALGGTLAAPARADFVLIRGATILPQDSPALEGDVLLHDDRIVKVAAHVDAPAGATIVEAKGRFLIPGLIDAHAHIAEEVTAPELFVPHGVTTVRSLGDRLDLVARLAADKAPWRPELVYVGPILDGRPPVWPGISEVLEKPEQVAPLLAKLKAAGCGWFKVYERLRPEVYDAIIKEAKTLGVRVIGHVPVAVSVLHCVESGQDTIEHLDHFARDLSRREVGDDFASELTGWDDIDPEKEKALLAALVAHGTRLDPTRLVERNYSLVLRGLKPDAPAARYMPKALQDVFWSVGEYPRATEEVDKAHEASFARSLELVKKASAAGVPILCGSDTANPYVVPGASVQEEIVELAKGLGPAKALECATLANARALGRDDLGRIAAGARADLVLLAKDPREDAKAVASIEEVFVRGHRHEKAALEARLALLEETASASDARPTSGFAAVEGTLSDRTPASPEWRFEGRLASYPASFWMRLRAYEGPKDGERLVFLRSASSLPVPARVNEDMLLGKEGELLRYHEGVEILGDRRETTIERRDAGWRVQLFQKGEIKLEVTVPGDERPGVPGQLLLWQLARSSKLEEGEETTLRFRAVDLESMSVKDAVSWKLRRLKNPVTDAKDARSRGAYFKLRSSSAAEAAQPSALGVWVLDGEPLGFSLELPVGTFVLRRSSTRKLY